MSLLSIFVFSIFLAAMMQPAAFALEKTDDIDTNRPSFMDSPLVVPKGSAQFENGVLCQHFQHGQTTVDLPETEVRLGVTKNVEFQAFVPNYELFHQQSSARTGQISADRDGVSDIQEAGCKFQLPTRFKTINVALIGGVTIPTGRSLISSKGVEPVLRMPWTKQLSKNWSAGGMQSLLIVDAGRDAQWQNFWMISRAFGSRTSVFAEYGGFYTHHNVWTNIAHFGAVRKLNKDSQIDMQWGIGMNNSAPAAFVGAGYSFCLDNLPLIDKL